MILCQTERIFRHTDGKMHPIGKEIKVDSGLARDYQSLGLIKIIGRIDDVAPVPVVAAPQNTPRRGRRAGQ